MTLNNQIIFDLNYTTSSKVCKLYANARTLQTDLRAADRGLKRKKMGIFSNGWRIPWFGKTHIIDDGLTVLVCCVDKSVCKQQYWFKHNLQCILQA